MKMAGAEDFLQNRKSTST
uniref:Uncharacterized protein n=1 Tax=Arundo donax TaxID=35708 RepID=A0A0A9H052_ARUDO